VTAAVIETDSLTKRYGAQRGIEAISMTVEAGEVFGFLGPNGAGKTTTIRTLLDLLRPTSGSARVVLAHARVGVGELVRAGEVADHRSLAARRRRQPERGRHRGLAGAALAGDEEERALEQRGHQVLRTRRGVADRLGRRHRGSARVGPEGFQAEGGEHSRPAPQDTAGEFA
jgi:ATPase subunit of ABC transporter with duplicated ATPase domains